VSVLDYGLLRWCLGIDTSLRVCSGLQFFPQVPRYWHITTYLFWLQCVPQVPRYWHITGHCVVAHSLFRRHAYLDIDVPLRIPCAHMNSLTILWSSVKSRNYGNILYANIFRFFFLFLSRFLSSCSFTFSLFCQLSRNQIQLHERVLIFCAAIVPLERSAGHVCRG
jgi:hypothetical protein